MCRNSSPSASSSALSPNGLRPRNANRALAVPASPQLRALPRHCASALAQPSLPLARASYHSQPARDRNGNGSRRPHARSVTNPRSAARAIAGEIAGRGCGPGPAAVSANCTSGRGSPSADSTSQSRPWAICDGPCSASKRNRARPAGYSRSMLPCRRTSPRSRSKRRCSGAPLRQRTNASAYGRTSPSKRSSWRCPSGPDGSSARARSWLCRACPGLDPGSSCSPRTSASNISFGSPPTNASDIPFGSSPTSASNTACCNCCRCRPRPGSTSGSTSSPSSASSGRRNARR